MTDSAPPASSSASTDQPPCIPNILARLEKIAEENPDLTTYVVAGEADAELILAAMAAVLHEATSALDDDNAKQFRRLANKYRDVVIRREALEYLRKTQDDPSLGLVIHGLSIRAPTQH